MPAIPGNTFGAGSGNFKDEKINPTIIPVTNASNVSFTLTPHFIFIGIFIIYFNQFYIISQFFVICQTSNHFLEKIRCVQH